MNRLIKRNIHVSDKEDLRKKQEVGNKIENNYVKARKRRVEIIPYLLYG